MRISVDKNDPGYYVNAHEIVYEVHVDGVSIENVITADERKNEVTVYTTDENGKLVLDETGESYAMHSLFGVVKIKFRKGLGYNDLMKIQ
jgi:hypothetical protein